MIRLSSALILLGLCAPAAQAVDVHRLPLGDGKVSASPKRGYVFSCQRADPMGGGAQQAGPWIDETAGTWDAAAKLAVQGTVAWDSEFTRTFSGASLLLQGNGLPGTPTGTFPIATTDPAYQYDRNPSPVTEVPISRTLPAAPQRAAGASCVGGEAGTSLVGARILSAFDALLRDAVAREVQDACGGHPNPNSGYHFHSIPLCLDAGNRRRHSKLIGYANDGFGIYGYRGEAGEQLTNADLDACHGHTHVVRFNGKRRRIYHYHATREFPYLVGCFRGAPTT